jgi:thiol-disulfide isomerase/thioredoxin
MKRISFLLSILFAGYGAMAQDLKMVKITDVENIIAESSTPLIINLWATWCKPCIEEIPYFQQEVKKHTADSLRLLLVSVDTKEEYPEGIGAMAKKQKFTVPILWLDETNADYFCPKIDPHWSGAIPATLFINNKTGYRKFFEEQLSHEVLIKEISALLKTD